MLNNENNNEDKLSGKINFNQMIETICNLNNGRIMENGYSFPEKRRIFNFFFKTNYRFWMLANKLPIDDDNNGWKWFQFGI